MNREQGLSTVCAAVADCLCLEPDKVTPRSRLITDLAATSLDILDLVFSLEEKFNVQIRDNELDALLRGEIAPADTAQGGFLAADAVNRLAGFLPAIAEVPDRARLKPAQIIPLITVESLWLLVERRVAAKSA